MVDCINSAFGADLRLVNSIPKKTRTLNEALFFTLTGAFCFNGATELQKNAERVRPKKNQFLASGRPSEIADVTVAASVDLKKGDSPLQAVIGKISMNFYDKSLPPAEADSPGRHELMVGFPMTFPTPQFTARALTARLLHAMASAAPTAGGRGGRSRRGESETSPVVEVVQRLQAGGYFSHVSILQGIHFLGG